MKEGFEDAFMDAQANIIALCKELLENGGKAADKIYVYMYQDEFQDFFNAFFSVGSKICYLNDWFADEEIYDFFDCGEEDIENIVEICSKYEADCPNEFRLIYDCRTGSFDTEYKYADNLSDDDRDLVEIYQEWISECEKKLSV